MNPARLNSCRVLELGCGEGANLIPIAFQWPESEFVGIDLSAAAIREGNDFISRMGLTNIVLRCHDIMQIGSEFGRFDYMIAHGVYSWVPDAVRDKMLSIFRHNLSPHGIAFVSYNCYPGCHSRDIARQIMRYHVRDITDPHQRALQSRGVLRFLAEASAEDTIFGFELRNQLDRINGIDDRVLFHDDLSDVASPFYLHQVVEAAAGHGLQYLSNWRLPFRTSAGFRHRHASGFRQFPKTMSSPASNTWISSRDGPFVKACSVTARSRCGGASTRAGSANITSRHPRWQPTARVIRKRPGSPRSGPTAAARFRPIIA